MPVFSFAHIYETINYKNGSARREIANFSDSLPNRRWILSRHELTRRETARVFYKHIEGVDVPFDVFFDSLRHLLYAGATEPIELIVEDIGFQRFIDIVSRSPELRTRFDHWHDHAKMLPIAQNAARSAAANPGGTGWLKRFRRALQGSICEALPDHSKLGGLVSRQVKENFERSAPWTAFHKWPAVYMYLKVCEAVALGSAGDVDPSSLVDQLHISALAYTDIFLCDRQTKQLLKIAKVPLVAYERAYVDLGDALSQFN